jgi:hypothetical protein
MKTSISKSILSKAIHVATLAALVASTGPVFAREKGGGRESMKEHSDRDRDARAGETFRGERHEQSWAEPRNGFTAHEPHSVSREAVRQHVATMVERFRTHFPGRDASVRESRLRRTRDYCFTLLDAGYDPVLVDGWLDALADDIILDGMPGTLVLDYYGNPLITTETIVNGFPARIWTFEPIPGRFERVTISADKVIKVRE